MDRLSDIAIFAAIALTGVLASWIAIRHREAVRTGRRRPSVPLDLMAAFGTVLGPALVPFGVTGIGLIMIY